MALPLLDVGSIRRRAVRTAAQVGGSAVDNALSAARAVTAQIAERRLLAPAESAGPGDLALLSRAECLQLLSTRRLGRLAYIARVGVPDIVLVNYALDGEDIVIHSGAGPKLQAAERGDMVAFEVDDIDEELHTGWTAVVYGRAHRLSAGEKSRLANVPQPWAHGPRLQLIRVSATRMTGRRLT